MKTLSFALILSAALYSTPPAAAQVPQALNYQGRVTVNGTAFSGTGQFRFALVDGAGTVVWSSHASATTSVTVSGGLYTVRLGDTSLPNMAAVPSSLFSNGDLRLRVWFNDGVNGVQQLTPDQRLAPVGYAHRAASVDSIPSSAIAPESIQPSHMASAYQTGYYDGEVGTVPATGGPLTITFPKAFETPPVVKLADGTTPQNITATGFTINVPPRDIVVDDGSPVSSNVGKWRDAILVGGMPAIAYTDDTSGDLKYVRATSANGSTWGAPVPVATGGAAIVGAWCSMAIVESHPAIAYYDETNMDLKFVRAANPEGTAWNVPVTVMGNTLKDYGKGCILKTFEIPGSVRRPVILYLNATDGELLLSIANTATGTSWAIPQSPATELEGLTDPTAFDLHEKPDKQPLVAYYDPEVHTLSTVETAGLDTGIWGPVNTTGGSMTASHVDIYNLQDSENNVAIMWQEASGVFSATYRVGVNTGRTAICDSSAPHSRPMEGPLPAIVSGDNGALYLSVASNVYAGEWNAPQRIVANSGQSFERPAAVRLSDGNVLAVFHATQNGGQLRVSGTTSLAYTTYQARLAAPVVATSVVPGSITRESLAPDIFGDSHAYGSGSFAVGSEANALGQGSFASGFRTTAGGYASTATGHSTRAGGTHSVAMGNYAVADGTMAVALGGDTLASGYGSTALGLSTSATANFSTALGQNSKAGGTWSLAGGTFGEAVGTAAVSIGHHTLAESAGEISLGIYPTTNTGNATAWVGTDRLFEIGNGSLTGSRSNAITILKDARTGFGAMDTAAEITHALTLPNSSSTGQGRAQSWTTYSDSRIKTEQRPVSYGLKEIMRLQPRAYIQHNGCVEHGKFKCASESGGGSATIGFIAQEVEQIIPEAVQRPQDPENQLYGMSYEKLIPVLVKAAQELKTENDTLKTQMAAMQARLEKLEQRQPRKR